MKFLITGANGYVGARIYCDLKQKDEVFGTYHKAKLLPELLHADLTSLKQTTKIVKKVKPEIIVHVSGNASAKSCNQDKKLAYEVNVNSTRNIIEAANKFNSKVIHISTVAAIEPYETYGTTKKESEKIAKCAKAGCLILRPSLIIGQSPNTTNDRPHNRLLKTIIDGTSPVFDDDWEFQPTYLGHLSEVIKICSEKGIFDEIIPITVAQKTTRFKLAKDILKDFGIKAIRQNQNEQTKSIFTTQEKLKELNLPVYDYNFIVKKTISEIRAWLSKQNGTRFLKENLSKL